MVNYATLWKEDEMAYLRKEYPKGTPTEVIARHLRRSEIAIRAYAKKMKLNRPVVWTEERDKYLKEHYHDTLNSELAKTFGLSEPSVAARAVTLSLHKDKEFILEHSKGTQFKKGMTPANKGKKITEFMSEEGIRKSSMTRFKKGNIPHNHKPVGWERYSKKYGWLIKVAEPNLFRFKHHVIWEKHHGEIPKGMMIIFKDKNHNNMDIDNLMMVSKEEHMRRNSIHNLPPEIKNAYFTLNWLNRKIRIMEEKEDGRHKQDERHDDCSNGNADEQ